MTTFYHEKVFESGLANCACVSIIGYTKLRDWLKCIFCYGNVSIFQNSIEKCYLRLTGLGRSEKCTLCKFENKIIFTFLPNQSEFILLSFSSERKYILLSTISKEYQPLSCWYSFCKLYLWAFNNLLQDWSEIWCNDKDNDFMKLIQLKKNTHSYFFRKKYH